MSRTTHAAPEPVDACRYFGGLLVGALRREGKERLLGERYSPVPGLWTTRPLSPKIDAIAAGSFKTRRPPAIRGTGYVVDALAAALWAFHQSEDFETGALEGVYKIGYPVASIVSRRQQTCRSEGVRRS